MSDLDKSKHNVLESMQRIAHCLRIIEAAQSLLKDEFDALANSVDDFLEENKKKKGDSSC
jgi:GMP synthase PP-ATPase subunit